MTAPSSERRNLRTGKRSDFRALLTNERGSVLAVMALALIVLLASAGLALDLGRGYVGHLRISRAVDAGALAGARVLRSGQEVAREQAEAVGRANGVANEMADITTTLAFGTNDRGEDTVVFSALRVLPTTFMRVVGINEIPLSAVAEAAVPPLDIVLVLDTSGSLNTAGAWEDLQDAARAFVELFSDQIDQVGLVSFQVVAANLFTLRHNFKIQVAQAIGSMSSDGDTNIQEGLRLARQQLNGPSARASAAKVVVFFTDGRPTAVRGTFGGQDRVMAVFTTPGTPPSIRGFFNNPGQIPPFQVVYPSGHGQANWPGGCPNVPNCFGMNQAQVRALAVQAGLDAAQTIRQDGVLVYAIGLGNHDMWPPGDLRTPDEDYLRLIANEGGSASASEPQGRMFFAPTGAQLVEVFEEVARDLVVRLAR